MLKWQKLLPEQRANATKYCTGMRVLLDTSKQGIWEHSIITLSQNDQKLDSPLVCTYSILVAPPISISTNV